MPCWARDGMLGVWLLLEKRKVDFDQSSKNPNFFLAAVISGTACRDVPLAIQKSFVRVSLHSHMPICLSPDYHG